MQSLGWMQKQKGESWRITPKGATLGAKPMPTEHGEVPAWPESVLRRPEMISKAWKWSQANLADAKDIARALGDGAESWEVNAVFCQRGWITLAESQGWLPTEAGYGEGGIACRKPGFESTPHVRWPKSKLSEEPWLNAIRRELAKKAFSSVHVETRPDDPAASSVPSELRFRTEDGHFVRSKAEVIIDNWLYGKRIVHAYEPALPGGRLLSDFYLPEVGVYIEFWGLAGDPAYDRRRQKKLKVYQDHNLKLEEVYERDILSLDTCLKEKLRRHGLKLY